MVKELYANVKDIQNNVVQVRGRSVPLPSNAMNAYYHILNIQGDEYLTYES